jgi:putative transposase
VLTGLTKRVLEAGLEAELSEHLGYDKHAPEGRSGENSRNGTRPETVLTEIGPVALDVPRDRDSSFEPQLVKKRQRRLHGVDEMVISLTAKGLTTGEVQAHLAEVYGANISRETVSKITDTILEEMADWLNRPLEQVYAAVFIDAIVVKIRDGQVTNRPAYCAIGVTADGTRDILGIWIGTGGEGAKFWLQVLTEIKNRGTQDVCMPESIETTWPLAVIQTCVLHLIRNTFRLASRRDWDAMARDLRPVYTAPSEQAAKERLSEFNAAWGETYPAMVRLWEHAWSEFVPFLDYSPEIRRVIYSTNAIESLHARMRRATRARGHFPNEQAALKCASTWWSEAWTRPGVVEGDGSPAGSPHSTPSRSPSKAACYPQANDMTPTPLHRFSDSPDDLASAHGEHQPIRAHEQFAVGLDAFCFGLRDDTAPKREGLQGGDAVRDLPIETLGRLRSVAIGDVVDDAQQTIDGGLGPRDGERSAHSDPRRSANRAVTSSSTDARSWVRPVRWSCSPWASSFSRCRTRCWR